MRNFFEFWLWSFSPTDVGFDQWAQDRANARALHHIIHKSKTEWIFSGTVRNERGAMQDAGYLRSPVKMRRAKALRYFARQFPRASIIHVDDKNKIITYIFQ